MARKKDQEKQTEAVVETENLEAEETGPMVELEQQLAEAREEVGKNWDLYLRSQAELENYRKRVQRDRQDLLRFGNENLLRELLPVVDNLDRAIQHANETSGNQEGLLEGVIMTLNQFQRALEKFGVTPIVAIGEVFDPARHEAMGQLVTSDHPPNRVTQELQKGYLLHDRLLRPAMVMVAKAPEEADKTSAQQDQEP